MIPPQKCSKIKGTVKDKKMNRTRSPKNMKNGSRASSGSISVVMRIDGAASEPQLAVTKYEPPSPKSTSSSVAKTCPEDESTKLI
jgi:hypothetical protein